VVEVEEGRLGPLEQDALAALLGVVDEGDRVGDHRGDLGRQLVEVPSGDVVGLERKAVVDLGEQRVLLLENDVQLRAEDLRIEQVLDTQADAGRLVGVGRTDAALGRAEGVLTEEAFGHPVEFLVVRHDQVRVTGDDDARDVDTLLREYVQLGEEYRGIDDDPVTDDRSQMRVEHAGGNELQREGLTVDDDAVTGVVATLVAHDHVHVAGQQVS
jgi:hypothetical protein